MLNIIPSETERIRQMMEDLGLNPDDDREDQSTPIGIGNYCGNNVVRDRANDGANQVLIISKCEIDIIFQSTKILREIIIIFFINSTEMKEV